VIGDWNGSGRATIGIFHDGSWLLDTNGNGKWDGPNGGDKLVVLGQKGDVPLVGAWSGTTGIGAGIFRNGFWVIDWNGDGKWDGPAGGDRLCNMGGQPGEIPLVGDWRGDGKENIGLFLDGNWYLDIDGNGKWEGADKGEAVRQLGQKGDIPVIFDRRGRSTSY
jgi:hypothetical protein